jgi:uncharacterized protein
MMAFHELDREEIRTLLSTAKTIAIVGASINPNRTSYEIMEVLMQRGYTCIPVNPLYQEVLGQPCYASLADIPVPIDIVDVFRKVEDVPSVIEEAIAVKAQSIWLQLGLRNDEFSAKAYHAGLRIVQDRCIMVEHSLLIGKQ